MRYEFPFASSGQKIGLLGGSFDPAHSGHVHITRQALLRFGLDQVWWLVSPGNPLKSRGPAPLAARIARARELVSGPNVKVTDLESRLNTRYTAETLAKLIRIYPTVRFTWVMGADNLAQFDQWQDWAWIMDTVPLGILARPDGRMTARRSKAARIYAWARLADTQSQLLATRAAPAWCFANIPMVPVSSTALRAAGKWAASEDG